MTDQELISGIKLEQMECYEQLIERYIPYIMAVVIKTSGSQLTNEDREELVSDVFLKLWKNRHSLNIKEGKEKAYMGTMARHMTLNVLKKKGLYEELPLEENKIDLDAKTPEQEIIEEQEKEKIKEAVDALPEPDREIFIRRYFYFQKVIHIAKALDMNEQTVATKLYRGKGKLLKYFKERRIME